MLLSKEAQIFFGLSSSILGIISYLPYLADIYKGKTKPHSFSWLIWTLVVGIAYLGQISDNGGAGTWNMGIGAILCLLVFLWSLKVGEKDYTNSDKVCLAFCLFGIVLWQVTDTPLWTMLIICIVDTIAFIPTYRKSYHKPFSETLSIYYLSALKAFIGLIALENFSLITAVFPVVLIGTNGLFAVMVNLRRAKLTKTNT